LIIAGTHGQEPQSCFVARKLIKLLGLKPSSSEPFDFYSGESIDIIPDLNRYGLEHHCRGNSNGVDLNRNMPTSNWSERYSHPGYYPGSSPCSEVETQALVKILEANQYLKVISIHTNHFVANANEPQLNYDGTDKSLAWAQKLADALELPLTRDIGYPTPGSLGSYCKENNIDCATLEFDDNLDNEASWQHYGEVLRNQLRVVTP
jgi:protein MpaA